jgi:hypothetical protein
MTEPTRGNYSIVEVEGFNALRDNIHAIYRMSRERQVEALATLLMKGYTGKSEYMAMGNNKVAKNTGIVNMNSATDCPNADSTEDDPSDVGVCQVPWAVCYAHKAENIYNKALPKRRLQEYLWDAFSADLWADALLRVKERKTSDFNYVRISEAGDFRHNNDIKKWNTISEKVFPELQVYTYSASHKLDWGDYATHEYFVVNASNDLADYGDRQFTATYTDENGDKQPITEPAEVPEGAILCPFEAAKHNGVDTDDRPHCGECTHCIEPESVQPRDVAIIQH